MRVVEFFNTVDLFNGLQTVEDVLWWMGNEKGMFSVNKAYKMMNQINHSNLGHGSKYGKVGYLTQCHALSLSVY